MEVGKERWLKPCDGTCDGVGSVCRAAGKGGKDAAAVAAAVVVVGVVDSPACAKGVRSFAGVVMADVNAAVGCTDAEGKE